MKKQATFIVSIIIIFICSCAKEKAGNNKKDSSCIVRVLEAGNRTPLGNAAYITSTCSHYDNEFGCTNYDEATTYTNSDGTIRGAGGLSYNHRIEKHGYWPYVNEPDLSSAWLFPGYQNYLPAPTTFFSNASGDLDSILIELFPVTTITVRVRNTGIAAGGKLVCQALFNGQTVQGTEVSVSSGTDANFQYDVFGNATNKIYVVRDYPLSDTVSIQLRTIGKNETLSLDFEY